MENATLMNCHLIIALTDNVINVVFSKNIRMFCHFDVWLWWQYICTLLFVLHMSLYSYISLIAYVDFQIVLAALVLSARGEYVQKETSISL